MSAPTIAPERAPLAAQQSVVTRLKERGFSLLLLVSLAIAILVLGVLLVQVFAKGLPRLNTDLITNFRPAPPRW